MKKKITRILTLSSYSAGSLIINGETPSTIRRVDKYSRASVKESLTAFSNMLEEFSDIPTGTKIKVTMKVVIDEEGGN